MSANYKENNLKNILHGFFLAVAMSVADPSTILPLIVHHFSESVVLVGVFASLLRGGAIAVQLFAAFYAQSYKKVMPYLKRVFLARFLSWLAIGLAILIIGDKNPTLTLIVFGIGLFIFSFSAGFGSIYFSEIIAKIFDKKERGKSMANRQFFAAIGAIISGGIAGWVLSAFEPPKSYAYLFIISSFLLGIGLYAFSTIKEPVKENVRVKEESFIKFLKNAFVFLKQDKALQIQILTILFSYSFLFAFPFVILKANQTIHLTGWLIGGFVTVQMFGALLGNLVWKKLAPKYKLIIISAFISMISAFVIALFAKNAIMYALVFFLIGFAMDGFKIAGMNLLFEIAPEDKRPIYVALQNNLTSIGLFFAIPGGFILKAFGYNVLYVFTIIMLMIGLFFATRLKAE
ncbi:MFS transporter [Caminibacter pacificus]|uniref:MFS transporter n=1 Tax=Caminibacter pacificus TaxID=1424653 RepID=A0AAJ4RDU7_9BACT|nr:MFS transporter [Caminibacter pacificus]NPA87591.1 MFS transporter [Campylobacterota bacterium]QCI28279.1 MFS transporter [Caminibacter pacificus]ROR41007.1 MFS transporter [Caminibacter pacificus]